MINDDLYWCSKRISLQKSDVKNQIHRLYSEKKVEHFEDMYRELQDFFKIINFNRKHLMDLLNEDFTIRYGQLILKTIKHKKANPINPGKIILTPTSEEDIEKMFDFYQLGRFSESSPVDNEVELLLRKLCDPIPSIQGMEPKEAKVLLNSAIGTYLASNVRDSFKDDIMQLLYELDRQLTRKEETKILKQKIGCIPASNNKVLLSYVLDQEISDLLTQNGIRTIQDLKSIEPYELLRQYPSIVTQYRIFDQLIYDSADVAKKLFLEMVSTNEDSTSFEVLKLRSEGLTLERIGGFMKVTRERIRQIEREALKRFQKNWSRKIGKELRNLLFAHFSEIECVSYEALARVLKDYSGAFIFSLEKISTKSEDMGCFVYAEIECINFSKNNWLSIIEEKLDELDEQITETDLFKAIRLTKTDLEIRGFNVDIEIIKKAALLVYKKNGRIYSKKRINLTERYQIIIEKYYKDGIRVYDADQLKVFKEHYNKEFNDPSIFSKTDRSISARLCDAGVQVGRGTYNLEYRVPDLSDELATQIKQYIDNGPDSVFTSNIFNRFARKLRLLNIDNRFMLHALLKRRFGNDLYFRRDYIAKTEDGSTMMESLDRYLRDQEGFFTIDEIDKVYPSSQQVFVISYLTNNPEYIPAFNRKWIKGSRIEITEEETLVLKKAMDRLLRINPIISTESVLGETRLKISAFYERNQIKYQFFLFGILSYLFADEYEFDRPFIATKGTPITKAKDRLVDYIGERDEVQISELQEYTSDNDLGLNSMQNFISDINDKYLRSESNLLTSISTLEIGDETPKMVDSILDRILGELVGVNARRIKYSLLPPIGKPWNQYLLASFIEHYSDLFNIVYTTSFYNNSEFIIVRRNAEIEDYETFKMRTQQ